MTRDILVSSSGVEGMMSADTYDRVRMWITVVGTVSADHHSIVAVRRILLLRTSLLKLQAAFSG